MKGIHLACFDSDSSVHIYCLIYIYIYIYIHIGMSLISVIIRACQSLSPLGAQAKSDYVPNQTEFGLVMHLQQGCYFLHIYMNFCIFQPEKQRWKEYKNILLK